VVDAYSVITIPSKPDLSKRVYGDAFSADDLHYLRTRDARAYYAIDDLLDAAFRRGFREKDDEVQEPAGKPPVDGEQKTAAPGSSIPKKPTGAQKRPKLTRDEDDDNSIELHVPTMKKGWKFAAEYGWGLVVHYHEGENKLKEAMGEDESVLIQAFHPLVADFGGVKRWDTDPKTGLPTKFYIQPNAGVAADIEVDASRCDIYTWGDISNAWQGYTSLGPSLDDIIGNRLWRATAGRRIRDYSTARYLIQKLNATAALDATEKAEIASAFAGVPHAAVPGEWKVDTVGGPIMIAQMAGDQAKAGVSSLFQFIAVISVNLAVINLLPIPVLDGGHLLFFLIEAVKGRPVSVKVREIAQQVGMVLLIMLMILVFYNDITRLFFS
jgi:hypothetical protein